MQTKLEALVAERQQISKIRYESGLSQQTENGLTSEQQKKMELIAERRQLLNIAEAQKQELLKLGAERDRLRQKTFPSFNVSRFQHNVPRLPEGKATPGFRYSGPMSSGLVSGSQTMRAPNGRGGPQPPKGSRTYRAGGRNPSPKPRKPPLGVWSANPEQAGR